MHNKLTNTNNTRYFGANILNEEIDYQIYVVPPQRKYCAIYR